jgi:hypothetical protein
MLTDRPSGLQAKRTYPLVARQLRAEHGLWRRRLLSSLRQKMHFGGFFEMKMPLVTAILTIAIAGICRRARHHEERYVAEACGKSNPSAPG